MYSNNDRAVLEEFKTYLVAPGEMLCFHGPWLEAHREALRHLTAIKLITKEETKGGYSLTTSGFAAIQATADGYNKRKMESA